MERGEAHENKKMDSTHRKCSYVYHLFSSNTFYTFRLLDVKIQLINRGLFLHKNVHIHAKHAITAPKGDGIMKKRWIVLLIIANVAGLIVMDFFIWLVIMIITHPDRNLSHMTDADRLAGQKYQEMMEEYQKQVQNWKSAGYQEGRRDYTIYGEKRGPNYPEGMMKGLPENGPEGNTKDIYDKSYEQGYQNAQKPR